MEKFTNVRATLLMVSPVVNESDEDEDEVDVLLNGQENRIRIKLEGEDEPRQFLARCSCENLERYIFEDVVFKGVCFVGGNLVIHYLVPFECFQKISTAFPESFIDGLCRKLFNLPDSHYHRFLSSMNSFESNVYEYYSLLGRYLGLHEKIPNDNTKAEIIRCFTIHDFLDHDDRGINLKVLQTLVNYKYPSMSEIPKIDRNELRNSLDVVIGQHEAKEALVDLYENASSVGSFRKNIIISGGEGKSFLARKFAQATGLPTWETCVSGLNESIVIRGSTRSWSNSSIGMFLSKIFQFQGSGILIINGIDEAAGTAKFALSDLFSSSEKKLGNEMLECDIDISHILVIGTAKSTEQLPGAFLSGNERIVISNYTLEDKKAIINAELLKNGNVEFDDDSIDMLLMRYQGDNCISDLIETTRKMVKYATLQGILKVSEENFLEVLTSGKIDIESLRTVYANDFDKLRQKAMVFYGEYSDAVQKRIRQLLEEEHPGDYEITALKNIVNVLPSQCDHLQFNPLDVLKSLDLTHFGLQNAKKQLIKAAFSVLQCRSKGGFGILMTGEPGVGKTTLAKAFAKALNRPFAKLPMNQVMYPEDLFGMSPHNRNARVGMILEAFNATKTNRCVLLFDEVEKASPFAVQSLLTAFDPKQAEFYDNYVQTFISTSDTMIIATANDITQLPDYILDRFVVVEIPSYTIAEKQQILTSYIIPRILEAYNADLRFDDKTIDYILHHVHGGIRDYEKAVESIVLELLCFDGRENSEVSMEVLNSCFDHDNGKLRKIGF